MTPTPGTDPCAGSEYTGSEYTDSEYTDSETERTA